jgi:hypothetical protein
MSLESEKIAKILRTDKDVIISVEKHLSGLTGKRDVFESIIAENERMIVEKLKLLGLERSVSAQRAYQALIEKIEHDDAVLSKWLNHPSTKNPEDWLRVLATAANLVGNPKGFFMKTEKATEFLKRQPPPKVMQAMGYASVDEMLMHEDLYEVYSALRFIEGSDWLNTVFFKQYEHLTPSDFEYRAITVRSLSQRWIKLSEGFLRKKHHNISHLKELGLIFTLPLPLDVSGEVVRNFGLILHYFHEVPFYSSLFERYAKEEKTFSKNVVSLLSGFVLDSPPPPSDKSRWLIVQRYLAKDDENDWRLFVPHLNPEALHWERAERVLAGCGECPEEPNSKLTFWQDLNWVGDYFSTEAGIEVLVSFNLIDTAMSLVKRKEFSKYLYHQQEALWNKIFSEYFGEEKMEDCMKDHIIQGVCEM